MERHESRVTPRILTWSESEMTEPATSTDLTSESDLKRWELLKQAASDSGSLEPCHFRKTMYEARSSRIVKQ